MTTYTVPAESFEGLQIELNRINKRSKKCGTAGFDLIVHNTIVKPIGNGEVSILYEVSIEGETPRIGGYTFIAKLNHDTDPSGESNIIYAMPTATVSDQDRKRPAVCEHCGHKRFRRDTFLLRNDSTGQIIQVGRSCIKDFIGHDPEKILAYAKFYIVLEEKAKQASNYSFQMNTWRHTDLLHFLKHVALSIRTRGWVSGKTAFEHNRISTKEDAWKLMQYSSDIQPEDNATATNAIAWAKSQNPATSDFIHNILTIATNGYIDYKSSGIAAAIVYAYQKSLVEKKDKIDLTKSEYVGKKNDKIEAEVTVISKSSGYGAFGPWSRVLMADCNGNAYITFTVGKFNPDKDTKIKIRGTVKDHTEFKGVKQTNLSRVKMLG